MLRSVAYVPPDPVVERALPLDIEDVAQHVRVESERERGHLERFLRSAAAWYEAAAGRSLTTATWDAHFDGFPGEGDDRRCGEHWKRDAARWGIALPRAPVQSVTSIVYRDTDGTSQTLSSSAYELSGGSDVLVVTPVLGTSWPASLGAPGCVRVRFVAGYGDDEASVPADVKELLRLLVSHYYDAGRAPVMTGTIVSEMPFGLRALFWSTRAFATS